MKNIKKIRQEGVKLILDSDIKICPSTETQASHIADATVNYATPQLDTEAETIVAINATNTKINAILAALENVGILASS